MHIPGFSLFAYNSLFENHISLHWHHNEHDGISNHQCLDYHSIVCWGTDLRKHQSSTSLTFVRGYHRWPHKGPAFTFDDVIMCCPFAFKWNLSWLTKCMSPAAVNHTDMSVEASWHRRMLLLVLSMLRYCKTSGIVMRRSTLVKRRPVTEKR